MREIRKFYRHPTEIPVEVWKASEIHAHTSCLKNASLGGLALICANHWQPESLMKLRLPLVKPAFETIVKVVWSRKRLGYFEVGVMFINEEDAFRGRMVEQLCQIELYRQKKNAEGINISAEDAAIEWIGLYAQRFDEKTIHYRQANCH